MRKITITTTSFGKFDKSPLELLYKYGLDVYINPLGRKLEKDEVIELCKDSEGFIAGTETLNAAVLERLRTVKVISRCGTGLDKVDLCAADRLEIKVFNTPDAPTLAVAELTIGYMLNLLRNVSWMDSDVRNGVWNKRMGNLLSGKSVGIIGFGRIGRKVAELLICFGCEIRYHDINTVKSDISNTNVRNNNIRRVDLDELLKTCDIISIHVSSNTQIIGSREIGLMKKGAFLINVSRGGVVDETVLYNVLKDGHLSGAALDVFEQEPYTGPLKELNNIILTPHIGSYAKEVRVKMEMEAAENLLKGLGFYK